MGKVELTMKNFLELSGNLVYKEMDGSLIINIIMQ